MFRGIEALSERRLIVANVIAYKDKLPDIHPSCFIASGAKVIGHTTFAQSVNCWFNAVVRGDVNYITVGQSTNIQDNAVLHVTTGGNPLIIGARVTIGHSAVLHACTIGDECLIGMGSVILDGAVISDHCLVAAGAVVPPGKEFPPKSLILGNPAKAVRELTDDEIANIRVSASHYVELSRSYM